MITLPNGMPRRKVDVDQECFVVFNGPQISDSSIIGKTREPIITHSSSTTRVMTWLASRVVRVSHITIQQISHGKSLLVCLRIYDYNQLKGLFVQTEIESNRKLFYYFFYRLCESLS